MYLEEKEYVVTDTDKDSSLDTPYVLDVSLNRHSAEPLYQQIFAPIAQLIKSGDCCQISFSKMKFPWRSG